MAGEGMRKRTSLLLVFVMYIGRNAREGEGGTMSSLLYSAGTDVNTTKGISKRTKTVFCLSL